jgi:hypothetical protein
MWLLSWLPDWIFHLITFLGLLGIIASIILDYIPFVGKYKLPLQVVAVLLLTFGVWFEGGMSNEAIWQERVTKLQAEIAQKEVQSAKANVEIQTKLIEKIKVVKEVEYKIKEVIKEHETIIDAECKVVPEVIDILNASATNQLYVENNK